jgi:hypothetical protein
MAEQTLPTSASRLVKPDGKPDETWYQRLSQMWDAFNAARSDLNTADDAISDAEDRLDDLETLTETLEQTAAIVTSSAYTALSSTETTISGISATAKMVVLSMVGVSWNNTAQMRIRIGPSGGVATSGYLGANSFVSTGGNPVGNNFASGFDFTAGVGATSAVHGNLVLALADPATNTWTIHGNLGFAAAAVPMVMGGSVPLSGVLERIQITTVAGTAAADAGSVSLLIYSVG